MRPAKAIINLDALVANYQAATAAAKRAQALAVVKANAYGHGAVAVARALEPHAPAFAVACIEEAIELRDAGISKPILLLEGVFEPDELATCANLNFWVVVENAMHLDALLNATLERPLSVWLGLDSGMHRLGLNANELDSYLSALNESDNVHGDIVLASHFACADELDNPFTNQQISNFRAAIKHLSNPTSLANSAGIMAWPDCHGDWVRPGYMLYGNSPLDRDHPNAEALKPVMTLKSAVISVREIAEGESVGYARSWQAEQPSKVATVAMGYGDGYPRHAPNGTPVLVNGQLCKLAGRVSMDMITVDVSHISDVQIGDEVVLWGEGLSVNTVADSAGTIGYELLTRMPMRTRREYLLAN